MIFGLYVTIFMLMILFFLIGVFGEQRSIERLIANFLSLLFAISTWVNSLSIEVPLDQTYSEYGLQIIPFGFIFLNVVFIILWFLSYRHEEELTRWLP